jgi:hypothetical protein
MLVEAVFLAGEEGPFRHGEEVSAHWSRIAKPAEPHDLQFTPPGHYHHYRNSPPTCTLAPRCTPDKIKRVKRREARRDPGPIKPAIAKCGSRSRLSQSVNQTSSSIKRPGMGRI